MDVKVRHLTPLQQPSLVAEQQRQPQLKEHQEMPYFGQLTRPWTVPRMCVAWTSVQCVGALRLYKSIQRQTLHI